MNERSTARDVMTESVISVSPEASPLVVLRLFFEEDIRAAPVIGDDGALVGVISSGHLLRAQEDEHDTARATTDCLHGLLDFSPPDRSEDLEDFQDRLRQRTVSEVMTAGYLSVSSDAPLTEFARRLRKNRIHQIWVEDGGRLCGVVSTLDRMPVIEQMAGQG